MATSGSRQNESPTLRLGIIGLGGGASAMIPAFARNPHYKVTAAADIDQEVLDRFQQDYQGEAYHSAEDLCKSPNVDVVYIATPNGFHMEHALMAAEYRKHIYTEKPMALTLEDADTMIGAAERAGVQLGVNVKHSFELRVQRLREMVRTEELGRLRMMHSWYFNDWLYRPRTGEEMNPDLGGGVPWRQGPHQFDIIRTVGGGLVRSVRGMTGLWDKNRPVAGCHSAFLEFENGVVATAVYSGYDHFSSNSLVRGMGEEGPWMDPSRYARARRELRNAGSADAELAAKRAGRYGGTRRAPDSGAGGGQSGGWLSGGPMILTFEHGDVWVKPESLLVFGDEAQKEIPLVTEGDGRDAIISQFYDAVVQDRPPSADGRWGKATLEVLLAVFESGKERREVFLAHQRPTSD